MKIKSLLLLGLAAMFGMNTFAGVVLYKSNGVIYQFDNTSATTLANGGKVMAISNKMADASTITIPATFVDGDGNTVKVVGFDANWENQTSAPYTTAGDDFEAQSVAAKVKNLNIDVTNIAPLAANSFAKLTILESITLTGAYAAADYTVNNLSSTVKKLTLTGLSGKTKVVIAADAWKNSTVLETVAMPTAAAEIGASAFEGTTKLATVTLAGTTKIGANAFNAATGLKGIDLAGVKEIGNSAFESCNHSDFKALTIPASIEKIGTAAFAKMTNLETLTITNDKLKKIDAWFASDSKIKAITLTCGEVTEIAANAFSDISGDYKTLDLTGCPKLKTVDATSFKKNAYTSVKLKGTAIDDTNMAKVPTWLTGATASLTEITFPDGITTIPAMGAFTAVTSVGIPKNVETIDDDAFNGWSALQAIKIKSHVKTIGDNAFDGCTALAKVDFSEANALTTIGANAFDNCPKLLTLDLSGATKLATIDATSFPANAYTSVLLSGTALNDANFAKFDFSGAAGSLAEVTLPAGITTIPANKFQNFAKLTSVSLPKAVETIGANAFDGSALTSIKIRENVTTINASAFANCADLATVNFSEAAELTTIGAKAFDNDPKLLTLDLSGAAKLATIAANSFPANAYTSVLLSGTALDDANFANFDFSGAAGSLAEVTLPAGITNIPANKFQNFAKLTSVSIPKAVTSIGNSAFENSGLTAVKIRENVTAIGASAFKDCSDLAIVNFTEAAALTTIGGSAFRSTAIKEAILPANVTTMIGGYQFADNAKLKSFSAKGLVGDLPNNILQNCVKLTGVVIPTGATGIGQEAFLGCSTLATVTFRFEEKDDALATNGIGAGAFKDCKALAALDLSATALTDLDNANIFQGCTALAEITFPETLTSLGANNLFADCPIENLDASNVTNSGVLFGTYWDETAAAYVGRDADNANTTLKTVKIGGDVPANCFAYCTALESVEYFEQGVAGWSDVAANAFEHCTGLKTFTFNPEAAVTTQIVDDDAFHGCVPFVHFVTNSYYMDYIAEWNNGIAPLNTTFGDAEITKIQTVQDKANPNQFFAKFYYNVGVRFNAEDCKIFTAYVDGETVYYQACRTYDGYYNIPANRPVIIKTSEAKEVSYELGMWGATSLGWNDLYCSQEGDDLAAVQDHMHPNYNALPVLYGGMSAGEYLYRLTNTADQGFGFTFYTGTTIKAGQFFIACEKKPEGAGRLAEVWLDENGNVIDGEATGIETVKNIDANDGAIYNLQGVRVDNPVKGGLYIQNGKKIVVK